MDLAEAEPKRADDKSESAKSGPTSSGTGSIKLSRQVSPRPVGWLAEGLTTLAAFVMFLGPGTTVSFYIVMVGFYEYRFGTNKAFFIIMLFAVYAPFPVITLLQANYDAYWDRQLSTRSSYSARIGLGLITLEILTLVWMFSPPKAPAVVLMGFLIGACGSVVQASGHQVISAIDPTKLIFSELGGQMGSVIPLVVFSVAGFQPSATTAEFRHVVAVVLFFNFVALATLAALHYYALFDKAFARLAMDLEEDPQEAAAQALHLQVSKEANETKLLDEPMGCSYEAASRQSTPSSPSVEVDKSSQSPSSRRNIPSFVYRWQISKGFMNMFVSFVVSMASFYGDPAMTQFLALIKLSSDFLGRLCALPLVRSEQFRNGPWVKLTMTTLVVRVMLFTLLVVQLGIPVLPKPVFFVVWCTFALLDRMMSTLSDVTCGAYVEVQDRKFVSRLTFFCGFGGLILGLGLAAMVAFPMIHHKKKTGPVIHQDVRLQQLHEVAPAGDLDLDIMASHAARTARAVGAAALHFALQPR